MLVIVLVGTLLLAAIAIVIGRPDDDRRGPTDPDLPEPDSGPPRTPRTAMMI
jgi:hypothetical protein